MMYRLHTCSLVLLALLPGCGGGSGGDGGPDPVLTIEKWTPSGDNQTDTAGQLLPNVLRAKVTQDGSPVAGVIVTFAGQGTLGKPVDTTDALGIVTSPWTLGIAAGPQSATATAPGAVGSPLTYNATAVPGTAVNLLLNAGDDQLAQSSTLYPSPLIVKVTDVNGNGIAGRMIHWSKTGPAVLTNDSLATNAQGFASQVLTATAGTGDVVVTATAAGLNGSPLEFSSTVVPTIQVVTVANTQFTPANFNIPAGSAVRWNWVNGTHSVTPDSAGAFVGSDIEASPYTHGALIFANPGVYAYHCQVHVGMVGTITVN